MRICVIGAGFTGLACALRLSEKGDSVVVFERESTPGGLANGFKDARWEWPLEQHYHHLFTSDHAIRKISEDVNHPITFKTPKTSTFYQGNMYQMDSPASLFAFPHFTFFEKMRTAVTLLYLRTTLWWKPFEKTYSESFLKKTMGSSVWTVLWQPLFQKKFSVYASTIPLVWFWARIKKRSSCLGYPEKGFQSLSTSIEKRAREKGADFIYNTKVINIQKEGETFIITAQNGQKYLFDYVVCTLPTHLFCTITSGLPNRYIKRAHQLDGIGAVNLVLALRHPFFKDKTYWLNVNDMNIPFLAVVEHTNLVSRKHYGGDSLLYIGNYLKQSHVYFKKTEKELVKEFCPHLKKMNPRFTQREIRKAWIFKAPFAQPIIPLHYSKNILPIHTPIKGLFLANIQQVYPWDRGTNYAVELGEEVARIIHK